ncbi:hypothetical protein CTI12_AA025770 [Artemisia annua]|uniref:Thiolase N-terminal domain-containing protein n=1 Tax=Artemisia annua TaxID=35608 RepID=A0A2U1QIK9_ARTAN|nr:hypothetical protein CTI12_AA025770 [Artemisia annua]
MFVIGSSNYIMVISAVTEKTNLNPDEVGDIVVGSVLGVGSQRSSECRMTAFYAGFPGEDNGTSSRLSSSNGDYVRKCFTAVDSNRKAAAATASGKFKDEIIHVKTKIVDPKTGDEKPVTISFDHGVRLGTTLADLAKIEPVFKKDGSTTAGFTDETTPDYQCNLGPDGKQGTLMNGLIYAVEQLNSLPQGNSWFM